MLETKQILINVIVIAMGIVICVLFVNNKYKTLEYAIIQENLVIKQNKAIMEGVIGFLNKQIEKNKPKEQKQENPFSLPLVPADNTATTTQ